MGSALEKRKNMLTRVSSAVFAIALAACTPSAPEASAPEAPTPAAPTPVTLDLTWRVGGLANPESAALSADNSFLYVTNVNGEGEAKDGNGFISKVSTDGKLLEREWSKGFDGPKGIVRDGDALHIADIMQLVSVDANTGKIITRTPLEGATFLNDVAIAPDGRILVADSGGKRIYAVKDDKPSIWIENDLLASINGLLPEPTRLVVTTMAGRLLAMDYATGQITVLAGGLGDADGVAPLDDGRYLVSEWPGLMHVVSPDGSHATIMDTKAEKRLLNDFLLVGDTLYQPHWDPGELSAYRVTGGAP
jgi:DNA-binding beta-propeller fold protein YncE